MDNQVLVIRKPDATIHVVELINETALRSYNNRLPKGQQWSFEKMDAEKAKELPYIDPNYVTAADAVLKVAVQNEVLQAKDAEIEELKAKIAALSGSVATGPGNATENTKEDDAGNLAKDVIAKIEAATSADEVKVLLGNDERKGVQAAAEKKLKSFN